MTFPDGKYEPSPLPPLLDMLTDDDLVVAQRLLREKAEMPDLVMAFEELKAECKELEARNSFTTIGHDSVTCPRACPRPYKHRVGVGFSEGVRHSFG